ncbi:hypothetical protein ABMA27_005457 [Loxostege sticticalis]|uniref:G-protein coupled receptors family 1 profile domain-containing protein n=1 Tax=Loxostege sticticalis TaxID=481309 RepID=A0ABR3HJI1_LOXSC
MFIDGFITIANNLLTTVLSLVVCLTKGTDFLNSFRHQIILFFLKAVNFFVKSFLLICEKIVKHERRKIYLYLSKSLVFRVMTHPKVPEFQQCVSFEAFANQRQELAYNVFCLCAMYFLPLMIITVCYVCIFYEISKNSKENSEKTQTAGSDYSRVMLRRSDQRPLARARRRTLRMTVTIVTVFACCWLPYATMTLWYMLDRQSAEHVSARVQDLFFIMAVSNSCMDPLVYGTYALDLRTLTKTMRKIFCIHTRPSEIPASVIILSLTKVFLQVRAHCARRYPLRFEETSTARPSFNSDPVHFLSERSFAERTVKPSQSCEVFVLHTPHRTFHS